MKIYLAILCFLGAWSLKGQDTICRLSGGCVVVDIWSQSRSKIKFKVRGDSTATFQVVRKKELSYVRWKEGLLDVYQDSLRATVDTSKIYRNKEGYVYKQAPASNKKILELVKAHPYVGQRREMLSLYRTVSRNNKSRYTLAIIGIGIVPAGALPAYMLSSLGDKDSALKAGLIYLGMGSAMVGISQVCNFRYHSTKKELVEMYNTLR